jgi:hypothetical protein
MSWKEAIKKEDKKYTEEEKTELRNLFGGQRDARVEYINKELIKDVDKLVDILKESPANIFHNVRRDFQEILAKYEEYLRD